MSTIYINGKFLGQPTTGAQRFALEIVLALDALVANDQSSVLFDFCLVIPMNVKVNLPSLKNIRVIELPGFSSHLWEQISLPLFVKNSLLINLSGSAPMLKRHQIFTIFDAAIFDLPQVYSRLFVAWYRAQFLLQSKFCYLLLTISEFSRDRLCYHLGVSRDMFSIIPCGVDHIHKINSDETVLAKYNLTKNRYFLAVGSANPSKNFSFLINAFLDLHVDQFPVLVVVGGANSAVFANYGVLEDERVIKVGRVDDAQLKALYSNARAFVFPSLYEGFGIPPLEAMACGCPVIASNATSIPEVCGNAVGYFDPASPASIQNALRRIVVDDNWRMLLQDAGRNWVLKYSWQSAAEKLLNHINENIAQE